MLSHDLDTYVVLQRARGLKFTTQSGLLRSFVAFAEAAGDTHIRTARALDWAAGTVSRNQTCTRLAIVRRFAEHLAIADPAHEVPPSDAFGRWRFERRIPHIYTGAEIATLMAAARRLGPVGTIRGETLATLIGLLAATGLRVSEALGLELEDVTADGAHDPRDQVPQEPPRTVASIRPGSTGRLHAAPQRSPDGRQCPVRW